MFSYKPLTSSFLSLLIMIGNTLVCLAQSSAVTNPPQYGGSYQSPATITFEAEHWGTYSFTNNGINTTTFYLTTSIGYTPPNGSPFLVASYAHPLILPGVLNYPDNSNDIILGGGVQSGVATITGPPYGSHLAWGKHVRSDTGATVAWFGNYFTVYP